MAVTHGHGNPNWTRDEVILALDFYFDCAEKPPSTSDPRVKVISDLLRAFPHHAAAARKSSFRNCDGVAFKLQNIRQVATGKGLANVSRTDREVWEELGRDPRRTKELANLIRAGIEIIAITDVDASGDDVFVEGRVVTETHLRRERNPKLRSRLIAQRRKSGEITCEICGFTLAGRSDHLGEAAFEVHHVVPLSAGSERKTRLQDTSLLCANCHRMIHRAIAQTKRWLTIEEAKVEILGKSEGAAASVGL